MVKLVCADACRDSIFGASFGGNAVAFAVMPDGSAGAGGATGLNNDKGDGNECDDGFHDLLFARRGFFGRMICEQRRKKVERQGSARRAAELLKKPAIAFLDEATSALDEKKIRESGVPVGIFFGCVSHRVGGLGAGVSVPGGSVQAANAAMAAAARRRSG